MTVTEKMAALVVAKEALVAANIQQELCNEAVEDLRESLPYSLKGILEDFNNFCNNSTFILEEDFENIKDPDEMEKYIVEAVGYARDASEDGCYLKEAEAICNAYLKVRDDWMYEIYEAFPLASRMISSI